MFRQIHFGLRGPNAHPTLHRDSPSAQPCVKALNPLLLDTMTHVDFCPWIIWNSTGFWSAIRASLQCPGFEIASQRESTLPNVDPQRFWSHRREDWQRSSLAIPWHQGQTNPGKGWWKNIEQHEITSIILLLLLLLSMRLNLWFFGERPWWFHIKAIYFDVRVPCSAVWGLRCIGKRSTLDGCNGRFPTAPS